MQGITKKLTKRNKFLSRQKTHSPKCFNVFFFVNTKSSKYENQACAVAINCKCILQAQIKNRITITVEKLLLNPGY